MSATVLLVPITDDDVPAAICVLMVVLLSLESRTNAVVRRALIVLQPYACPSTDRSAWIAYRRAARGSRRHRVFLQSPPARTDFADF